MSGTTTPVTSVIVHRYLNTREAANYLGVSPRTLEKWRIVGGGPPYRVVGARSVRYSHPDLEEFVGGLRTSTSDDGEAGA